MTLHPTAHVPDVAALDGLRVFTYWNLHRHLWSLRAAEGDQYGRVVAHADTVHLDHAEPRVSEAGRQRVIATGHKNVHAGIVGRVHLAPVDSLEVLLGDQITYNPTRGPHFTYVYETHVLFAGARWAHLDRVETETGHRPRVTVAPCPQ